MTKWHVRGAVAVMAIVTLVLAAAACGAGGQPKTLSGTTLDGKAFDLTAYRGQVTVVNFFGSWCGPCNLEAPDLAAFAAAHADVAFVGVDLQDTQNAGLGFAQKYGLKYPLVADPQNVLADAWKVTGVPTTFFLDRSGVVKATLVGAASRDMFEESLKKAL